MRQSDLSVAINHAPTVSGLKLRYPDRPCGTPVKHLTVGGNTTFAATGTPVASGAYTLAVTGRTAAGGIGDRLTDGFEGIPDLVLPPP